METVAPEIPVVLFVTCPVSENVVGVGVVGGIVLPPPQAHTEIRRTTTHPRVNTGVSAPLRVPGGTVSVARLSDPDGNVLSVTNECPA
jgi:hypothetical protein